MKHYLSVSEGIDLAEAWKKQTGLPIVFPTLCNNIHEEAIRKLANTYARTKIKIPQYILKKEGQKRGITPKELTWYLSHIHYKMDHSAKKSLKLFLKKSKKVRYSRA